MKKGDKVIIEELKIGDVIIVKNSEGRLVYRRIIDIVDGHSVTLNAGDYFGSDYIAELSYLEDAVFLRSKEKIKWYQKEWLEGIWVFIIVVVAFFGGAYD